MDNSKIAVIEMSSIKILNPRSRNKFIHNEIKESIDLSGLRKPITVRKIIDDKYQYALICGQGRMEALLALGETYIPAIIKTVSEEDAYIMSLIENVVRRKPRATELYERIREMFNSGVGYTDIAKYVGCSEKWVRSVFLLLEQGEQKLLYAVESGKIPLYLAVEFARSNGEDNQNILIEAYEKGVIKTNNISKIRLILEMRNSGNKGLSNLDYQYHKETKKISPEQLLSIYQENVTEHKHLLAKNEYVSESLSISKKIIQDLLSNEEFLSILKTEGLNDIPSIMRNDRVQDGDKL